MRIIYVVVASLALCAQALAQNFADLSKPPYSACGQLDASASVNQALTWLRDNGGGTLYVPCIVTMNSPLVPPYLLFANQTPYAPSLRINCGGQDFSFFGIGSGGGGFDLKYDGTSGAGYPAKINLVATGEVEIENCRMRNPGTDNLALMRVLGSVLTSKKNQWSCNQTHGSNPSQNNEDAIQFGGIDHWSETLSTTSPFGGFFGWGASSTNDRFQFCRRAFTFGGSANGIMITNPTITGSNGGDAAFYFTGAGLGSAGNIIVGGIVEMGHYQHGAIFASQNGTYQNKIAFTGFYDEVTLAQGGTSVSVARFDQGACNNSVEPSYYGNIPIGSGSSATCNKLVNNK